MSNISENNFVSLTSEDFRALIDAKGIDHIDFGCSKGGSLEFAQKRFHGRHGLGIDISHPKVVATREAGYQAICFDIQNIPDEKLVDFVVLSHFLEHVPDRKDVVDFIRKGCVISKNFVYIQQPFFDADSFLFAKGLKLFWSDWRGHPNRMTTYEMWVVLRNLQNEGLPITFSILTYKKIENSSDVCIHPIASSIDQHDYDADIHPPKDLEIVFDQPVFRELVVLITLPGCDHEKQLNKVRYDHKIICQSC